MLNANLCPLVVVGHVPMESTAQPVKGTFGMSRCIGFVKTLLGRNCAVYMY